MKDSNEILRNLTRLKWQGFFAAFRVFIPIQYLFFRHNGLSYTQISLLVGAFFVGMFLFEMPSGVFSDKFGRKAAIGLSALILTLSFILFYLGDGFLLFLFANFLQGVGEAFNSGSDEALIFDSLKEVDRTNEFSEHFGAKWGYFMFGAATSSLLCSAFSSSQLKLTFLVSAFAGLISLVLALLLIEPKQIVNTKESTSWAYFKVALGELFCCHSLRHLVIMIVIFNMTIQVFFQYLQFLVKDIGVPLAYLGVLYAAFIYLCGYSAKLAHRIGSRLNARQVLKLISALLIVGTILPALTLNIVFVIISIILIEFAFGIAGPLLNGYFQHGLEGKSRATTASVRSFAVGIAVMICAPIFGTISDKFGYQFMMLCLSFTVIAVSAYSIDNVKEPKLDTHPNL